MLNVFLGIKIEKENGDICLSRTDCINKLFNKYNLQDCRPVITPIVNDLCDYTEFKQIDNKK